MDRVEEVDPAGQAGVLEIASGEARSALDEILRSPDVERVRQAIPGMGASGQYTITDATETLCLTVKELDLHLLNALKESMRRGLISFEEHESTAAQNAGASLLRCLESIPRLCEEYLQAGIGLLSS